KNSGKPIIAYSEVLSTGSYLMAMHAQEIFVHPSGAVAINGLGGYRNYNKELLEKLRITIHNYSQGNYKSAVEGYTRSNMSDPDREQTEEIINPIWNDIKTRVASARKIDSSILQLFVDDYSLPMVEEADYNALSFAIDKGLIDGIKTYPQLRGFMIDKFGSLSSEDEISETYPHISWQTYSKQIPTDDKTIKDAIAVVFVQGGIMPGPAGPGIAGAEDIAPLIRAAYEKDSTRALVVRVNSPGGSIIGSDLIRDEIEAARYKGLPVIVSMGDVAASGGVWVSTPANTIFAEPHTITGSIGVAVTIPTLENVFDWAGINFDGVQTGEHAGWSPALPMNEKLDSMFSRWASGAYQHFVSLVAKSRERDIDYIKSIAGGRVWLAPKALEIGLIDNIGGITEAIDFAAEMAHLEDYSVDYVVPEVSPIIAILEQLPINIIRYENSFWSSFAKRFEAAMSDLNSVSSPKATVTCSQCLIEIL
ncbi:MAG: signal peptide peptidase SppA, partial [Halieaceae bacterium]|nr:signal peptide peptidase SppA [Halieaceae bacterium]